MMDLPGEVEVLKQLRETDKRKSPWAQSGN